MLNIIYQIGKVGKRNSTLVAADEELLEHPTSTINSLKFEG
jgi:hypothetical protein